MTNAALNIFVRVVKRRLDKGESLEEIFNDYPNLTDEEKEEIIRRLEQL